MLVPKSLISYRKLLAMKTFVFTLCLVFSLSSLAMADDLKTLQQKKLVLAQKGLELAKAEFTQGVGTQLSVLSWRKRVLQTQLLMIENKKARILLWKNYISYLEKAVTDSKARHLQGMATQKDTVLSEFHLIEAKIELAKLKKPKKK